MTGLSQDEVGLCAAPSSASASGAKTNLDEPRSDRSWHAIFRFTSDEMKMHLLVHTYFMSRTSLL